MAKILIESVAPRGEPYKWSRSAYQTVVDSAQQDPFKEHLLTQDPAEADIILFAEVQGEHGPDLTMKRVLSHPLFRKYASKVFLYWQEDLFIPFVRGLYPSIEKRWQQEGWTAGAHYVVTSVNPYLEPIPMKPDAPYLASFIGSVSNAPVRAQIAGLQNSRYFMEDVSKNSLRLLMTESGDEKDFFLRHYAEVIRDSKFILCPRGVGVGSIRIFETLRMGRVPVIFSDGWVAPAGPDWNSCAVIVAEKDALTVLDRLKAMETDAPAMGQRGQEIYDTWFSHRVLFHRFADQCVRMQEKAMSSSTSHLRWYPKLAEPLFARRLAREFVQHIKK